MSSKKEPRPMAICESCYLEDHTRWEPESMDENGTILMKLVGVDVPNKINTESVETCCLCGALTIAGIFEVKKPSEVYFLEDDEIDNNFEMSIGDIDEGF